MRMPRLSYRLRTLMVAVAVIAVGMGAAVALWRFILHVGRIIALSHGI